MRVVAKEPSASSCGWGAGARNPGHWHTVPEPHDTGPNGSFDLRRGGLGVLKYRQQTPPFCALGMCGCTACGAHPAAANGPACLHAGGTAGVPALFPSHLTCPLRTTRVDCLQICAPNDPIHKKNGMPPCTTLATCPTSLLPPTRTKNGHFSIHLPKHLPCLPVASNVHKKWPFCHTFARTPTLPPCCLQPAQKLPFCPTFSKKHLPHGTGTG